MKQPSLPLRPPVENDITEHQRVIRDVNIFLDQLQKRLEAVEQQLQKKPIGWGQNR